MTKRKHSHKTFDSQGNIYLRTIVNDYDSKYPLGFKRISDTHKLIKKAVK